MQCILGRLLTIVLALFLRLEERNVECECALRGLDLFQHPLEVLKHTNELMHIEGVERLELYRRQGLKQVLDLLA